jgi:hypothetical protein
MTTPRTRRKQYPSDIAQQPKPGTLSFSVPETAWVLSSSPNHVWLLIKNGHLKPFKNGRKTLISLDEVEDFMARGGTAGPAQDAAS